MPEGRRPPKAIDAAELATILAFADKHTDSQAAKQFGCSVRTIQRKRADLRAGKLPLLAALFAKQKKVEQARCEVLLNETYAKVLRRIQEKLADATFYEACGAAKILGDTWTSKQVLMEDTPEPEAPDDEHRPDSEGPSHEKAQDPAGTGAATTH